MDLNAYAILDGFIVLLRCCIAAIVAVLGIAALRRRTDWSADVRQDQENSSYLLLGLTALLAAFNVVSWPLFYLMLQSMVPHVPGAMCIYGVTQLGAGSDGVSRFLPSLVSTLQLVKPLLIFLSGTWLVVYRMNRRTKSAPLWRRVVAIQVLVSVVALVDGLVEGSYLAIPKRVEIQSVGCCTVVNNERFEATLFATDFAGRAGSQQTLRSFYYGLNLFLIGSLWATLWSNHRGWRALLAIFALAALPVTALFMVRVAAPTVLHLPYHHCLYDLIPIAPDMVFAIVLFVLGVFAIGWGFVAQWMSRMAEFSESARREQRLWWSFAFHAIAGSMLATTMELILA